MLKVLTMMTLAAAAPAQGEEVRVNVPELDLDVRVPPVEVQVPEIDIRLPALGFGLPELAFVIPGFGFRVDHDYEYESRFQQLDALGREVRVDIRIPEVQVTIPRHELHGGPHLPGFDGRGDDPRERQRPADWQADTDTTFEVGSDVRLEVRNHAGRIEVRAWDRDAVRVQARHSTRDRVKIFRSNNAVSIKSESRHGPPDVVDYTLRVPRSTALDLWGVYADVNVEGVRGGVRVETLNGNVEIRDSDGDISLRTVEGRVLVRRAKGRVEVNSVEEAIVLEEIEGTIYAEAIDGDIRLDGIRSESVEAKTVDGDIYYRGSIADGGRYRLTTHDGDVVVEVPEGTNAEVSVATFDGEFEATFPIEITKAEASRRFSFMLGNGAARLELHSFDGDIRLVRR